VSLSLCVNHMTLSTTGVILSEVVVRKADDNAVEGPLMSQSLRRRIREFSPPIKSRWENAFMRPSQPHREGILQLQTASHARSSPFAQDDR